MIQKIAGGALTGLLLLGVSACADKAESAERPVSEKVADSVTGAVSDATDDAWGGSATPSPTVTPTPTPFPDPTPEVTPEPTPYAPSTDAVRVTYKTMSKQCFGSAGCNVTIRVDAHQPKGDPPAEGVLTVFYEVTGDEDGPIIGNLVLDLAAGTYVPEEESVSTPSSGTVIKVKVTDIEYDG